MVSAPPMVYQQSAFLSGSSPRIFLNFSLAPPGIPSFLPLVIVGFEHYPQGQHVGGLTYRQILVAIWMW